MLLLSVEVLSVELQLLLLVVVLLMLSESVWLLMIQAVLSSLAYLKTIKKDVKRHEKCRLNN